MVARCIGIFNCENIPVAGWGGLMYDTDISFRGAKKSPTTDVKSKKIFSFVILWMWWLVAPRLNFSMFLLEKIKICPKISGKCVIKTCFL